MINRLQLQSAVTQAADFINNRFPHPTRFGVILGTGAGILADRIDIQTTIDYGSIPHFPHSTALGHKGQLVCGRLANQSVIAMQGRFHLYEGYDVDLATLPIHVFHRVGVEILFISNASGGINPTMKSGDIMLIDSHIDFMFRSTANMVGEVESSRPLLRSDSYDRQLIDNALDCSRRSGFAVYRGVYAAMLGPNYETRAEYRFLKKVGADAVGMSTVPEVCVAAKYGIRVLGLSVITNTADPDRLRSTSGQEVIDAAGVAAPNLGALVVDAIENNA